jgi:acyl-CoA reductase-like NAD-dependent aldehyde dehydrogenase
MHVTEPGAEADVLVVRSPIDRREVGRVPIHTAADVSARTTALREAQPAWEALGFRARAGWLREWRDWFFDNEQRLLGLLRAESGKSLADAGIELPVVADVINYYAKHGEAWLAPERPRPHAVSMALKQLTLLHRPHQLVGLITPWNVPIATPMLDLPAAMLAGCAVLCKPSEYAPLAWAECIRGWREEVGAPPILDVCTGYGDTGAHVVEVVDAVEFTGSVRTGRTIAARCGERLIPCNLELGGKDPMLVLADADLERAASAAVWGGFTNSGRICVSVERVYVEAGAYDDFLQRVTEKARALRIGSEDGDAIAYDYGSMANAQQLQIVETHVEDARARGAKVLTGGQRLPSASSCYEPTVLVDVDHSMACMRDETFGPLLPIMKVADVEHAISLANDSRYGLSASVWTRDRVKGLAVAQRLRAGAVNINNVAANIFQLPLPHHGWGESGLGGRLGGRDGILKFTQNQAIVAERYAASSEVYWYPAAGWKRALQAKVMRLLGARDWCRRLGLAPRRSRG